MRKVATVYRHKPGDGIDVYERPDGTAQHECASGPGVKVYASAAVAITVARLILGNSGRVNVPDRLVNVKRY